MGGQLKLAIFALLATRHCATLLQCVFWFCTPHFDE